MKQPLLVAVQLNVLTFEDQMAALGWTVSPKVSTLKLIRARARAVRPQ